MFTWQRVKVYGLEKYTCWDCPFEVLTDADKILAHCQKTGHGIERESRQIDDYIRSTHGPDVMITFGYLCWNTQLASYEGALALVAECCRLRSIGVRSRIIAVDNGSTDDTFSRLVDALSTAPPQTYQIIRNKTNCGISRARNQIIDSMLLQGSDYLMMLDGDIEVIPLSSHTMMRYLKCHPLVGCIGAYSGSYTDTRQYVSKSITEIPESTVKGDIRCAFTQYGMFNCAIFDDGIRFDTSGPLGLPGWGYEDDDLYYQMLESGWANLYFNRAVYLHRNVRSSIPNLRRDGVDVDRMFRERQQYVADKWQERGADPAKLRMMRSQTLPKA